MLISELIKNGAQVLKSKKISSHLLDSELILSKILKKSREKILISTEKKVSSQEEDNFYNLIKRRLNHEPLAYIFNEREFWSKNFFVNTNTLIPRPETELLVEHLSRHFKNKKISILDIGTGSGCILLSLLEELKDSCGVGIDISKKAIKIALKNSNLFKLNHRSKFYNRSLDQVYSRKFDLIVSNPPYICSHEIKNLSDDIKKYEPRIALDGGNDGLDVIKKVIYKSNTILKKKGMLALEIGYGQFRKVSQILKAYNFRNKFLIKDYQNNIRCIMTILEK
jgi:release factor glutamine methyltransferase